MAFENQPNKQLTKYSVERTTIHDSGLLQLPAAGNAPAIFVRISAPTEKEVISWCAECEGGHPVVPSPYGPDMKIGLNENLVFEGSQISTVVPMPTGGDKARVYCQSGTYTYGKKVANGPVTNYPVGKMPWEKQPVTDNSFPKDNFKTGILDPTAQPPPEGEGPPSHGP